MAYTIFGGHRLRNLTTASATRYHTLIAQQNSTNGFTTEVNAQGSVGVAGVWDRLGVYVPTNGRVTNVTFKSRVNGADGNQTITVPAGTTGWFSDTTNADSLSVGDKICVVSVTSTGTQTLAMQAFVSRFDAASGSAFLGGSHVGTAMLNSNFRYGNWAGQAFSSTENDNARTKMKKGGTLCRAWVYIGGNTFVVNNATIQSRINGVTGNILITVPFGVTGFFEDTTNTDSFSPTDKIGYIAYGGGGGSGNMTIETIGATVVYSDQAPEIFKGFNGAGINVSTSGGFYAPIGSADSFTTEAEAQLKVPFNFTMKNVHCWISGSGSVTNTYYFKPRINGADGVALITILPAGVGYFEDTTATELVSENDLLCFELTATGSGIRQLTQMGFIAEQGAGPSGSGGYSGPGLIIGN